MMRANYSFSDYFKLNLKSYLNIRIRNALLNVHVIGFPIGVIVIFIYKNA